MNPSSRNSLKSLLLILGAGLCLVALAVQAAPVHDPEDASELSSGASEEAAANGESEFDEPGAGRAANQEDEDLAPANPLSMADSQEEPRGLDSNIANAKVQMSPTDMATAAGHHYHHGHSVSGKMEMGAHTEKKGAFGWHAKFPVGGKGKK